jgi:hypothetical protein
MRPHHTPRVENYKKEISAYVRMEEVLLRSDVMKVPFLAEFQAGQ